MKTCKTGFAVPGRGVISLFALTGIILGLGSAATAQTVQTNLAVTVRHAPSLNGGTIQGSLQQLNGESVTANGGLAMTGDLLVPGTPTLVLNGKPAFSGTIAGSGSTSPSGYQVTLNGNCSLRYLRTRTTPVLLPTVPAPSSPTGTRSVTISSAGQSYGDATTLRNLTLNGNVGMTAVPPGTYGTFTVNGGSGLVLGVAGGLQAVNYNLQNLNLNGSSTLKIVGPVVLTVANGFTANGTVGASNNPAWLQLQVASGGFTLNGGCTVYGLVLAPNGMVIVNGNSTLVGTSASDQFILNGGGLVRWCGPSTQTNPPPVATPQSITLAENSPININLTGSDSQGRTLTFTLLTLPAHGTASGTPPSVTYRPATNFFGSDAFTFKVNNGITDSSPANVSLTITQVYYPPTAFAQSLTNFEDTALSVTLTGYDPQGYALTFSVLTQPPHGTLSGTASNLVYRPATNYFGNDSFTFRVGDGVSNSGSATISITNRPVDDPPVVFAGPNQLIILPANSVSLAGLVTYDVFPGTVDTVVWSKVSGPGNVTFGTPSNALTTAAFSQSGIYRLRLFASDSFLSASSDLFVTVDAPPVVNAGPAMTNTFPGTVTLPGSASDDGLPTNGTLTVNWSKISGPGTVVFGNAAATNSTATFSTSGVYVLRLAADDSIATNHSDVSVIENFPPVANAGTNILTNGLQAALNGIVTDDGLPGSFLSAQWSQSAGPGTVTFGSASATNTTVTASQSGTYILVLTACDGAATNSSELVVTFNLPPVVNAGPDQTVNFGDTVTLVGTVTDDQLPHNILTSIWTEVSGSGNATFADASLTNTTVTFDQPGTYTLRLTASDTLATTSADVVIRINAAPVADNQTINTLEDAPVNVTLTGSDADGDMLAFQIVTAPAHGTLSGQVPNLVYTPAANYNGSDSFTFLVNDGQVNSATATVSITVNPVNDAPQLTVPGTQTISQGVPLVFDTNRSIFITDVDAGGGQIQLELSVVHGSLSLSATNGLSFSIGTNGANEMVVFGTLSDLNIGLSNLNYVGSPDYSGTDMLTLTVNDQGNSGAGGPLTDTKTVAITANPANFGLLVEAGPDQTVIWTNQTVTLNALVTDIGLPDGSPITVTWTQLSGDGTVTFYPQTAGLVQPANGQAISHAALATFSAPGVYVLSLTADDTLITSSDEVTITVNPPNEAMAALEQSVITPEDTIATITLMGYDSAARDLSFTLINPPQHGAWWFPQQYNYNDDRWENTTTSNSLVFAYRPDTNFNGADSFSFKVNDGQVESAEATVSILVTPANDPPDAFDTDITADEGNAVRIPLVGRDAESDPLTFAITVPPEHGTVALESQSKMSNSIVALYTSEPGYTGFDQFRFTANDGQADSAEATATITITSNLFSVDAGPDRQLSAPGELLASGSVQVQNPVPGALTNVTWFRVYGPGTVVFSDPSSLNTSASINAPGTYVLRLSAEYAGVCKSDTMEVVVLAGGTGDPSSPLSNQGTDFWLAMMENDDSPPGGEPYLGGINLMITSSVDTKGFVTAEAGEVPIYGDSFLQSVRQPFVVRAGMPTVVNIFPYGNHGLMSDSFNKNYIHVTAEDPVSVSELNYLDDTTDGYAALPTSLLGTEYVIMAYRNSYISADDWTYLAGGTSYAIVGTVDNTIVTITPSVTFGSRIAGVPYQIRLNPGQTYEMIDRITPDNDFTGTLIVSDKPVAVFGGHKAASVPSTFMSLDHLEEQLPPVSSWGREVLTMPLATRMNGDTFRILASKDGTDVQINGEIVTNLNRGQFCELVLTNATQILASQPILVAQYANGDFYDTNAYADPFMMILPAVDHYGTSYVFGTAKEYDSWDHIFLDPFNNYVNLIAPDSALGSVLLDGNTLPTDAFVPIADTGYSGAQIHVEPGVHKLAGAAPFCASVYGWAWCESYGEMGGFFSRTLDAGAQLSLAQTTPYAVVGTEKVAVAKVTDAQGAPLADVTVQFMVTGSNPASSWITTGPSGEAAFSYFGQNVGVDIIEAKVAQLDQSVTNTWVGAAGNQPPVILINPFHIIRPGCWYELTGVITDDGLPAGSHIVTGWRVLSGPIPLQLQVTGQASAAAYFEAAGTYTLELTASDGEFSARALVNVMVNQPLQVTLGISAPDPYDSNWSVGVDSNSTVFAGQTVNLAAETFFYDSLISRIDFFDGQTLIGQFNPTNTICFGTRYSYNLDWVLPRTGVCNFYAVVTDDNGDQYRSETIQVNVQQVGLELDQVTPMALVGTEKVLVAHVTDAAGTGLLHKTVHFQVNGANSASAIVPTDQFGDAMFIYTGTNAGTDVIEATLYNTRVSVTNAWVVLSDNQPPVITVNANQTALQNRPFQLVASVTDDGVPAGRLSAAWRFLSGPSDSITGYYVPHFAATNEASTTVTFDVPGSYYLELTANDSVFSTRTIVNVFVDAPPSFQWYNLQISRVSLGQQIMLHCLGWDNDSAVLHIELYDNNVKFADTYNYGNWTYWGWIYWPVDVPWSASTTGAHALTAVVTDEQGYSITSSPYNVVCDEPPTVAWLNPSAGQTLTPGKSVSLTVRAADPDGTVTNVAYYIQADGNWTWLGNGTGPQFTLSWTPPTVGDFVLLARATDNFGIASENCTMPVHVTAASIGVNIVSPDDSAQLYANSACPIILDLNDPAELFDHAEFFANGVSLGQTTNNWLDWVPSETNDYTLTAKVFDLFGQAYNASNTVTVHVLPPPPPEIVILSPTSGDRLALGQETLVEVDVNDPAQAVTNIELLVDGVKVTDSPDSYISWTPGSIGSHQLTAVAADWNGNWVTSAPVNVTVVVMHPPTVTVTSPADGIHFTADTLPPLAAAASDPDGIITNLTLELDGVVLGATNGTTLELSATNILGGWHSVLARATDNDGLTTASTAVSFFIERSEDASLPVPAQLAAQAVSATEIRLNWLPLPTNTPARSVLVEKWSTDLSAWIEIGKVPIAETNYADPNLNPETSYRYRAATTDNQIHRSAYSAEARATTRTVVPNYSVIDLTESLIASLTGHGPGANILTNSGLNHFDSRRTVPLDASHAESVLGTNATALKLAVARFKEQWPQIQLDYDPVLLSPKSVLPRLGYLTGPGGAGITVSDATAQMFDPDDPDRPVKAFLQEYQILFGFGPEAITNATVQRDDVSTGNGARTVVWQQQVAGVPVFDALLIGHITSAGELACLSSEFIPAPAQAADPAMAALVQSGADLPLSSPQAIVAAVTNIGDRFAAGYMVAETDATGVTRQQTFSAPDGIKGNARAELAWFPASRSQLKLCWQVLFTSPWRDEMYLTLVAADTGEILYRRNLTAESQEATYRVYTNASPAPLLPGLSAPGTAQPATVDRGLVTLTALDDFASPNGWIADGDNETRGNNVDAHLDRNDDDIADLPRPAGNPSRVFDFPLDLTAAPANYGQAATVQLFYWDNWMHDALYQFGFTEAAGNFQSDNFGRGGLGNDAVQADAQDGLGLNDGNHANNANMSTPPDGCAPRMQMYVFDGASPARDGSLDAQIVLHEYTHGLSTRLVGGGAGIDALQSAGMGEGWSDFYALALLTDPAADVDGVYPMGAYVTYHGFGSQFDQNYYYGIRRYPYCTDTNKNPLMFADIDPWKASAHDGVPRNPLLGPFRADQAGEVHSQGEVWCMMLWEMRANLIRKLGPEAGNNLALQLVTDGLKLSPPNPNFVQARDAILLAERMWSGGTNSTEIWSAFAKRGLGFNAKAPESYTTSGAQESHDLMPALAAEQVEIQNGSGSVELGADNNLLIHVRNQGDATATHVSGQLATAVPGVTVLQGVSTYSDIPQGGSGANAAVFQIQTGPGFVEGTPIDLAFAINSDQSAGTNYLRLFTGVPGAEILFDNYSAMADSIPASSGPKDLTPWDIANAEPLWMADDASCLLKVGEGQIYPVETGRQRVSDCNQQFPATSADAKRRGGGDDDGDEHA